MVNLKKVNFGFSDAFTEAERTPLNFKESFFDPHHYLDELINGDCFIVYGKKGDGKSAYGAKLTLLEDEGEIKTYYRSLNNFNNIVFQQIQTYRDLGGNPYISFWKCLLMIETIKMLHIHQPHIQKEKYIEIFNALNEYGFLDHDIDIATSVSKLVESNTTFNIKSFLSHGRKREYSKTLRGSEQIYSAITNAIEDLYLENKFYLIIDGLDDILNNDKFDPKIITGLLRACDEINRKFAKKTLKLKAIVLIRSDIFNICRDPNLSKLKRDSTIGLSWTIDEDPFESDLFKLVEKRFRTSYGPTINIKDIWKNLFPSDINGKPSIDYVLENIIYRPRDILQFFIETQKEQKDENPLTEEQLQTVLSNYSENYFIDAMMDEMTGFFPDDVVTMMPEIFSKLGTTFFDVEDFCAICKQYPTFENVVILDILEKLFNDGYIGQVRPRVPKDYTVFRYRNPRENFQKEHKCILHRGLTRAVVLG